MSQFRPGDPSKGVKMGQIRPEDPPKGARMAQIRLKIAKVQEIFIFQAEFVWTVLHFCLYTQVKT